MSMYKGLILASVSPRRSELMRKMGLDFHIVASDLAELPILDELPNSYVARIALEKALRVASSYSDHLVIGADTVVSVDDRILGKPRSARDAEAMLTGLSGRWHEVWTGLAVVCLDRTVEQVRVVRSEVCFRALSTDEIAEYISGGEPMDKAGAYAIQGEARRFVTEVKGSYHNIIGLPTMELSRMLDAAGYPLADDDLISIR